MSARARVRTWLAEPLDEDVAHFIERIAHLPDAAAIAVMPDVHLAPPACVGTVVATRTHLYPELLGSDLGCGIAAIPLGVHVTALERPTRRLRLLEVLARAVPVLTRRNRFDEPIRSASCEALDRVIDRDGRVEIGTIGRGNHFIEVHAARDGMLHLVVHTGSRAIGPAVQRLHLERTTISHRGLSALVAESQEGLAYLHDVGLALELASRNRAEVMRSALCAIGDEMAITPIEGERIDCQHDSVLRESHDVGEVWVHRKGAMALSSGARGVVPGSMGTETYLVVGRDVPEALASSAHGAGRAVPRGEARRRFDRAHLADAMRGVCFDARKAAALLDEAPAAYKDVRAVLRAQRELVSITQTLRPMIVHKGG